MSHQNWFDDNSHTMWPSPCTRRPHDTLCNSLRDVLQPAGIALHCGRRWRGAMRHRCGRPDRRREIRTPCDLVPPSRQTFPDGRRRTSSPCRYTPRPSDTKRSRRCGAHRSAESVSIGDQIRPDANPWAYGTIRTSWERLPLYDRAAGTHRSLYGDTTDTHWVSPHRCGRCGTPNRSPTHVCPGEKSAWHYDRTPALSTVPLCDTTYSRC